MAPWHGSPGPGLRSVSRCPQRPNWLRRADGRGVKNQRSGGGAGGREGQDGDGGGGGGGSGGTSDDDSCKGR
jgi:hypothetical protein